MSKFRLFSGDHISSRPHPQLWRGPFPPDPDPVRNPIYSQLYELSGYPDLQDHLLVATRSAWDRLIALPIQEVDTTPSGRFALWCGVYLDPFDHILTLGSLPREVPPQPVHTGPISVHVSNNMDHNGWHTASLMELGSLNGNPALFLRLPGVPHV